MVSPIVDEIAEERTDIKGWQDQCRRAGRAGAAVWCDEHSDAGRDENGQIANKAVGAMPKENILALL